MSLFPLIAQMQKSNQLAQQVFYDKYFDYSFAICNRYIGIDVIAQELVSDGFLKFFQSVGELVYVNDASVIAFLRKIMVNQALMHIRRAKKQYAIEPLETVDEDDLPLEESIESAINVRELYVYISRLPEDYRIVFCMYAIDGFNHVEIAETLNISPFWSRLKFFRAKKILRETILKNLDNDERRKSG